MGIPKRTGSIVVLSAVTALLTGTSSPPALASTWTVSPGGAFQAPMPSAGFVDHVTSGAVECGLTGGTGSVLKGALRAGTGSGFHLGTIRVADFQLCFSGHTSFTVTASNTPWYLNAVSYASGTGTTTGHLTGIHLVFSGANGCSFAADGTSATAGNGSVKFVYHNTHRLFIGPGSALHIYNVTNCGTMFNNNDLFYYDGGSFSVTPRQTITSP